MRTVMIEGMGMELGLRMIGCGSCSRDNG
jgi:hypothetical protein